MKTNFPLPAVLRILPFFLASGFSPLASAADRDWNGNESGLWIDPLNWTPGILPDATTSVLIDGNLSGSPALLGSGALGASAALSIQGDTRLRIQSAGTILTTSGPVIIGDASFGSARVTAGAVWNATTPGQSFLINDDSGGAPSSLILSAGGQLNLGANKNLVLGSTGTGGRAQLFIGELVAGGATAGTLIANSVTTQVDGLGQLIFTMTDDITWSVPIAGNIEVDVRSGGLLLDAANSYNGDTFVRTGARVRIANGLSLGFTDGSTLVEAGGALEVENSITVDEDLFLEGTGILGNGALRNVDGSNTVNGLVTLTGDTKIQSDAGLLTLGGGVEAADDGYSLTVAAAGDIEVGSLLLGSGGVQKEGTGTLTVKQSLGLGTNTYSGQTNILDGTFEAGNNQAFSQNSRHFVESGAILDIGNFGAQSVGSLTGSGNVLLNSSRLGVGSDDTDFAFDGLITSMGPAFLIKRGSGVFTLTNNNPYAGTTIIQDGTLRIGIDDAIATPGAVLVGFENGLGNALFDVNDRNQTVSSLGLYANFNPNSARVDIGAAGILTVLDSINFLNIFSPMPPPPLGFGALIQNGTLNLAGGIVDITVNGNENAVDLEISSTIINGSINFSGPGDGVLLLSGANTYGGGTTINSGTLRTANTQALGAGDVNLNGGVLDPVGILGVQSDLNWQGGQIASTIGNPFDRIDVTNGFLNLGGTEFLINTSPDAAVNIAYTLVTFGNTDYVDALLFQAVFNNPDVQADYVFELLPNEVRLTFLNAFATGAILQNSNPVNIPTFADFTVNGVVTTGTPDESNTINRLLFNPGSSLQVFNNLTVTSGIFDVPNGSASLFGGSVITPGDLNKLGAGNLITNTNFQVGGAANIQAGGLIVNGRLTTPGGLTVFQNALLGGSGVINGNVFNNGTLAPGNSVGTLTINGNYVQSSSGTFQLEIASPGSFDRLLVSGNAALAGTLQVLNLGKNLKYGQQYAFLQAGSISGEFDTISMPNPSQFRGRFLTNGGTGTLVVAPTSYTLVAETPNQQRVAKALDSYIPASNNDRETVSIALDLQSEDQYPASFDQIAPTFHESVANISIEQAFAQTQILNQRLSSVRLGAAGFQAIGIENEPLVHDKDGKSVADAKDLKSEISNLKSPSWSLWAMGNGFFGKATNVSHVPNYRFDTGGFFVGGDYRWSENFSTGLYTGYQYTWADYSGGGNTQINSALFGGYASYTNGGFYTDAVVGGGYNAYRVRRPIEFSTIDRTARSNQNGGQFNAALNFGYDWEIGKFTLGPIAGVQYSYVGIASFTEDGADSLDLRVGQQNANSLRTTFGGRIAYSWNVTESITLIPEVRMFWQHEFLNNPRTISSSLDGGAGPGFGYETSAPARDSVFAGAGLTSQFGPNWNAFFFYNADFGRQDYLGHYISGGLGLKF